MISQRLSIVFSSSTGSTIQGQPFLEQSRYKVRCGYQQQLFEIRWHHTTQKLVTAGLFRCEFPLRPSRVMGKLHGRDAHLHEAQKKRSSGDGIFLPECFKLFQTEADSPSSSTTRTCAVSNGTGAAAATAPSSVDVGSNDGYSR